jgi:hypothetical protein
MANIPRTARRGKYPSAAEIAAALGAEPTADGWRARCPAHNDRTPSLSIGESASGKVLLYCHRGCSFAAIMRALGVRTWRDRQRTAARADHAVARALQRRDRP